MLVDPPIITEPKSIWVPYQASYSAGSGGVADKTTHPAVMPVGPVASITDRQIRLFGVKGHIDRDRVDCSQVKE